MYNFGAGRAYLFPAGGTSTSNGGMELGTVQNASLELKVEMKELRGPFRYPVAVADGKGTASGKVTFANIWPQTVSSIVGGTLSTGQISPSTGGYPDNTSGGLQAAISESFTIPASTPYTYTLAQATSYLPLTEIVIVTVSGYGPVYYQRGSSAVAATSSTPTAGRYTIVTTTGVITFAAGDAGNQAKVTYLYSTSTNPNTQVGIALQQVGLNTALTFQLNLIGTGRDYYTNGSQQFIVQLNACLAPSLKFDFKLDDFTMMDLDFDAFIDVDGNLGYFYLLNP